jgi:hypothetical protein
MNPMTASVPVNIQTNTGKQHTLRIRPEYFDFGSNSSAIDSQLLWASECRCDCKMVLIPIEVTRK